MKTKFSMVRRLVHFWDEENSLTALLSLLIIDVFISVPESRAGHVLELIGILVFAFRLLAGLLTMARHRMFQVISGVFVISTIAV